MKLHGRTAIVTGGSSGIGRAIALRLSEEGAAVVVADIREEPREGGENTAELIREQGGQAEFVRADVQVEEDVRRLVDFAVGQYGSLDIMCNNAGVSEVLTPVADTSLEDLTHIIGVNLIGTFLGCKHAARRMINAGRGGVIVNTASCFGLVGYPDMAAYCATKGAVIQLTRSLALELAPYKIRVNAICPGTVDTEMDRAQREDPVAGEEIRVRTPLLLENDEFACNPYDQAGAVAFIVSEEARWMTGSCVVIDGGWTAI